MSRVGVKLPLELNIAAGITEKVIAQIKAKLQEGVNKAVQEVVAGTTPVTDVAITKKFVVRRGRRRYEFTGVASPKIESVEVDDPKSSTGKRIQKTSGDTDFQFTFKEIARNSRQLFLELKQTLRNLPKSEQLKKLDSLLSKTITSNTFDQAELDQMRAMQRTLGESLSGQKFRTTVRKYKELVEEMATKPIEDQIRVLEQFSSSEFMQIRAKARNKIQQLQRGPLNREFSEFREGISGFGTSQQIAELQAYEASGRPRADRARRLRRKLQVREHKETFKTIEEYAESLTDLTEKLQIYSDYINQGGFFSNKASKKLNQLSKGISNQALSKFKTSIRGLSIEEQYDAWFQFAKDNNEFMNLALANQRVLENRASKADAAKRKNDFRSQINQWKALDQPEALQQLENFISAGLGSRDEIAKATRERNRIQRNLKINAENDKRARQRAFASNMLAMGGVGIGLFGAAGFPLLNVGFAAMSGGMGVGIVAGVATALGESTRAVESFRQATLSAAQELNLISPEFKATTGRFKALDAMLSSGAMTSQQHSMQERLKTWKLSASSNTEFFEWWTNVVETFKRYSSEIWQQGISPAKSLREFRERFGTLGRIASDQFSPRFREKLETLAGMERSFMLGLGKGPGIENDPYATWLRIQNAAFDPAKAEEMEIQRSILETVRTFKGIIEREIEKKGMKVTSATTESSGYGYGPHDPWKFAY